jgi:hypothetical protein
MPPFRIEKLNLTSDLMREDNPSPSSTLVRPNIFCQFDLLFG